MPVLPASELRTPTMSARQSDVASDDRAAEEARRRVRSSDGGYEISQRARRTVDQAAARGRARREVVKSGATGSHGTNKNGCHARAFYGDDFASVQSSRARTPRLHGRACSRTPDETPRARATRRDPRPARTSASCGRPQPRTAGPISGTSSRSPDVRRCRTVAPNCRSVVANGGAGQDDSVSSRVCQKRRGHSSGVRCRASSRRMPVPTSTATSVRMFSLHAPSSF